jgi:hypothetical protein
MSTHRNTVFEDAATTLDVQGLLPEAHNGRNMLILNQAMVTGRGL